MKKVEKKKYEEYADVPPGENVIRKKVPKPWQLEAMMIDENVVKEHAFFYKEFKKDTWVKDSWFSNMLSVKHCIEQMNKLARTTMLAGKGKTAINEHWRFAGRKFRVVNTETKEIVSLLNTDTEFYAESE